MSEAFSNDFLNADDPGMTTVGSVNLKTGPELKVSWPDLDQASLSKNYARRAVSSVREGGL